jgi:hypothetical protein
MKETPIIMTGDSVRKIYAGQKNQTRRLLRLPKRIPKEMYADYREIHEDGGGNWIAWAGQLGPELAAFTRRAYPKGGGFSCPYGRRGEVLWVKETWAGDPPVYRADYSGELKKPWPKDLRNDAPVKWKSPLFLPRSAARLILEITDIRPERLQSITMEDCIAEGVQIPVTYHDAPKGKAHPWIRVTGKYPPSDYLPDDPTEADYYRAEFASLWNEINFRRASWEYSPWVWTITFKRVGASAQEEAT